MSTSPKFKIGQNVNYGGKKYKIRAVYITEQNVYYTLNMKNKFEVAEWELLEENPEESINSQLSSSIIS